MNRLVGFFKTSPRVKPILLAIVLFVILTLILVPPVRAQGIVYGSTVPAGQVVENDAILTGTTVSMDGTVDGDLFAAGNTVEINGTVNGSLVAVGENVTINGKVEGTVYTAGLTVTIGPKSDLSRNLYVASAQLETQPDSSVGRDLYALSVGGANLKGQVGRDVNGIIGPVEFIRMLIAWIQQISGANLLSALPPVAPAVAGQNASLPLQAGLVPATLVQLQQGSSIDWPSISNWLLSRLREIITLLVIAGLAVWLIPDLMVPAIEAIRRKPFASAGWGLMVILSGYVLIALISIAIFFVSAFFYALTLSSLGTIIFSIGMAGIILLLALFSLLIAYGSKAVVAFLIGRLIFQRFAPQMGAQRLWPVVLGVIVYVLLRAIPLLGWVIGVIATLVGMGAMWLVYQSRRQSDELASPSPETPALDPVSE